MLLRHRKVPLALVVGIIFIKYYTFIYLFIAVVTDTFYLKGCTKNFYFGRFFVNKNEIFIK
jgi:hypothetical protein